MAYDIEAHTAKLASRFNEAMEKERRERAERLELSRPPRRPVVASRNPDEVIVGLVDAELRDNEEGVRQYQQRCKPYLSLWNCAAELVAQRDPERFELARREARGETVARGRTSGLDPKQLLIRAFHLERQRRPRMSSNELLSLVERKYPEAVDQLRRRDGGYAPSDILLAAPPIEDIGTERTAGYPVSPRLVGVGNPDITARPDASGRVNTPWSGEGDVSGTPRSVPIDQGDGDSSPVEQFATKVKELMATDPGLQHLDPAAKELAATARIAKQHPDLYMKSQRALSRPIHSGKPAAPDTGTDDDEY